MENRKYGQIWAWIFAVLAAVVVMWWVSATFGDRNDQVAQVDPASVEVVEEAESPKIVDDSIDFVVADEGELAADPGKFVGTKVAIDGIVANSVGPERSAFLVDTDGEVQGSEILILKRSSDTSPLPNGETVHVVGTVRQILSADARALEQELGYQLDDNILAEHDNRVVVVADTVTIPAH